MTRIMKRILIISGIVISVIIFLIVGGRLYTKSFSPEDMVTYVNGDTEISVEYCRPSKKGRKIFGELEPYGEIWRTGANEATMIRLSKDFKINGELIKAGKYSLFSIPGEDSWTIIFNDQLGQWGTIYNEERDVLRVQVDSGKLADAVEKFTIEFEAKNGEVIMILKWDDTEVKIPFVPVS